MREVAETMELAITLPGINVLPEEYVRLLGFPKGWQLEGRSLELAGWARNWYAKNGHPWIYGRQAESFEIVGDTIRVDGTAFTSKRLKNTLQEAGAHNVILAAVSAGPEAEEESRRRWLDEKPDEYFFLEIFASAVVEHLITSAGARVCDWAENHGMAVLPHYSPGYSEWEVAEQPLLLDLIRRTRKIPFPANVEVFDSGMLRPKKTLLAVFGLTHHTDRLRKLNELVPCETCSFGPCQYRRAPYRRTPQSFGEALPVPIAALDRDAAYSVNRRALKRWSEERLSINTNSDGSLDAHFRYEGTTCTNLGRSLAFDYAVKLGPRAQGFPILDQRCAPSADDEGHTYMCKFLEDPAHLMDSIDREKPLSGEKLNAVVSLRRQPSVAGCYCEPASREHKWGLVLETIHYALVQREFAEDTEIG